MKKNALVVVGSKYGSTYQIGRKIAEVLNGNGFAAQLLKPDEETLKSISNYDVIFLGSGIYAGRWRKDVKDFIQRNLPDLKESNVYLFSSGPVGNPPRIDEHTDADGRKLLDRLSAKEHRIFAGKLDMKKLSIGYRLMMKALRAPEGDYRDWREIEHWVESVVRTEQAKRVPV